MFEKLSNFFNKMTKPEVKELASKDAAKERLHLVLMQDRANVSVDFLELMKQEIIDVIKKYIVVDENAIDVRLTNQENADGTMGEPSLYANIPIINIKNDIKAEKIKDGTLYYENGELEKVPANEETNIEHNVEEEKNDQQDIANIEVIELGEATNIDVEEKDNSAPQVEENSEKTIQEESTSNQEDESVFDNEDASSIQIELEAENVEPILDFVDDEDDEDVTFDDLLKKAEEEEAMEKEQKSKSKSSSKKSTKKQSKKKR